MKNIFVCMAQDGGKDNIVSLPPFSSQKNSATSPSQISY